MAVEAALKESAASVPSPSSTDSPRLVGRYLMAAPIAVGGMASVHLGRLDGQGGFRRAVAIKRMLAPSTDTEARAMLLDEARLASRIRHANVAQTMDVVEDGPEVFLVLEYVHGESLEALCQRQREQTRAVPPRLASAIVAGALRGLHAAHEARGDDGELLDLVHRDFSPHNVLVGVDGVPRVLDFGVARARGRLQGTRDGQLKGKLAYLAPEQVHGDSSRQSDVFSAGVVLWEALSGERLFDARSEAEVLSKVLLCRVPPLDGLAPALQQVVERALEREPLGRYATALDMAEALEACGVASTAEVGAWVREQAAGTLTERDRALAQLDALPVSSVPAAAVIEAPRRAAWPWLAVGVVAAAALGLVATQASRRASPPSQAEARRVAPGPSPTPTQAPTEARAEAPTPPVSVERSPRAAARPRPPPVEPAPRPPEPSPTPGFRPTADACNPPFVIDSNGVKQFKVECLK